MYAGHGKRRNILESHKMLVVLGVLFKGVRIDLICLFVDQKKWNCCLEIPALQKIFAE